MAIIGANSTNVLTSHRYQSDVRGLAGTYADQVPRDIYTGISESKIVYGSALVVAASPVGSLDKIIETEPITAAGAIRGIAVFEGLYTEDYISGNAAYSEKRPFPLITTGDLFLYSETANTDGEQLYVRITVNGGLDKVSFGYRNDSDSGNSVVVPNSYWLYGGAADTIQVARIQLPVLT